MDLPIINIANQKRNIFLFTRDEKGKQHIENVFDFFPFYYEPSDKGKFMSYDGIKLKKVFTSEPKDIPKLRSMASYSADIKFLNNYLTQKVDTITKAPIKYFFLDIEVIAPEFPDPKEAKYPVACISIYNSFSKQTATWYLGAQEGKDTIEKEALLLTGFIDYIKREKPDIILGWNVDFDYTYLYNRVKDFATLISPLGTARYGINKDILYPNGISIVDYMSWDKKVTLNKRQSYALDNVAQEELNEKHWEETDFTKLNDRIIQKNINDVVRLAKLEYKLQYIPYFDEVRRLSKCQWEDLYYNSRIIEMLLFEEAKQKNIVLPNKVNRSGEKDLSFQGATRDAEANGVYENIGKFDLTSAYPSMIVNFCLDSQNLIEDGADYEMYGGTVINNVCFRQRPDSLLPSIVKKLLVLKNDLKKQKKDNPDLNKKYDAIKSIVNSAFGVMGSPFFRLYDTKIASTITFLVRDLLMYTKDKLNETGNKVIYWDTDSLFVDSKENLTGMLNGFVQDWAKTYEKKEIDLAFEYEGYFKNLFILGKCHYVGNKDNGKKEIKGVEIKRSSSTKYEAWFQENLIDKVLNKETKDSISEWIAKEKKRIITLPLEEVAFPCKIQNKVYKNYPIFLRAYDNTVTLNPKFLVNKGELFYYIFVISSYKSREGKSMDVLAFTKENKEFIQLNRINWKEVIRRSIDSKVKNVFDALNWSVINYNQESLF